MRSATAQTRFAFAEKEQAEEFVANLNANIETHASILPSVSHGRSEEPGIRAMKRQTIRQSRLRLSDFNR